MCCNRSLVSLWCLVGSFPVWDLLIFIIITKTKNLSLLPRYLRQLNHSAPLRSTRSRLCNHRSSRLFADIIIFPKGSSLRLNSTFKENKPPPGDSGRRRGVLAVFYPYSPAGSEVWSSGFACWLHFDRSFPLSAPERHIQKAFLIQRWEPRRPRPSERQECVWHSAALSQKHKSSVFRLRCLTLQRGEGKTSKFSRTYIKYRWNQTDCVYTEFSISVLIRFYKWPIFFVAHENILFQKPA